MFNIKIDDGKKFHIIGRFSAVNTPEAENIFNSVHQDCVVDLKDLEYISSAGIGTLLKTYSRLKESGNSMKFVNLNKHVSEVLKYSGLDKVFVIE